MILEASLLAAGHVFRDGWPDTGDTHIARAGGGVSAIAAGMYHWGWQIGIPFGLAMWAGFYIDSQHGEGQDADEAQDIEALLTSGISSLFLVGLFLTVATHNPWFTALGFAKVPIWFGCWFVWRVLKLDASRRPYPTQVAAGLFGAVIGACM